jgi:hypothetical protein
MQSTFWPLVANQSTKEDIHDAKKSPSDHLIDQKRGERRKVKKEKTKELICRMSCSSSPPHRALSGCGSGR